MEITLSDEETKQAIQLYLAMNGVTRKVTSITFTTARNTPPTTKALIELDETSVPNERIAALAKHRQDLILHTSGMPSLDSIVDGDVAATAVDPDGPDNPANYPKTDDNPEGYIEDEAIPLGESTMGNDKPAASPFTTEEVAASTSEPEPAAMRAQMPGEKDLPAVPVEPVAKDSIFGGATTSPEVAETVDQIKQADASPFDSPDTATREKPPEAAEATSDDTVSKLFG